MDERLNRIPAKSRPRFREILTITDAFCEAHLNAEFRDLCRDLAAEACAQALPVTSGKAAGWAAGVVAAVGSVNFLGDPSQPFHMTLEDVARRIGVSPATLHKKLKEIREVLDLSPMDPRFGTRQMVDQNPLNWILSVNGMPMDIRQAPRGAQEEAFRRGLIPYIPADVGKPDVGDARRNEPRGQQTRAGSDHSAPRRVYTLMVSLLTGPITKKFVKKNRSIVRTIEIRGDQTLEDLHDVIFEAYDRFDSHMYEFQMGERPMDPKGPRYVLPMAADDDFGSSILGTVDQTTIDSMGLEVGRQFGYWFDFGDDWFHQIDVEKIEEGRDSGSYPRVIQRVGESPPQYADADELN